MAYDNMELNDVKRKENLFVKLYYVECIWNVRTVTAPL